MPNLKNIFVNPEIRSISDTEIDNDTREAVLHVTGLLCYTIWVDRVTKALEGLPEVTKVEFVETKDYFIVQYRSTKELTEKFSKAIASQIVVPGVRKALGSVGGNQDRPTL